MGKEACELVSEAISQAGRSAMWWGLQRVGGRAFPVQMHDIPSRQMGRGGCLGASSCEGGVTGEQRTSQQEEAEVLARLRIR